MGNSTVTLQSVSDGVAGQGVRQMLNDAGGYASQLICDIANDVMADLLSKRFIWKWNRFVAKPFLTNMFQQDYPQIGNQNLQWLQTADRIHINNTTIPKPQRPITVRLELPVSTWSNGPVAEIAWYYNRDLEFGEWPGPNVTYSDLIGPQPPAQNPLMSMVDGNLNLLIVTGYGTTGAVPPLAAANSVEGTTVQDGSVTWTVVAASSKGFRVLPRPAGNSPIWKIAPVFQGLPRVFPSDLSQTIDPIPDEYARHFKRGFRVYALQYSPNPEDRKQAIAEKAEWYQSMEEFKVQGDKENQVYGLIPALGVVESIFPRLRNPMDPAEPY